MILLFCRFLEEYERVHYFGDDEGSKKTRFDLSMRINRRPTNFFSGCAVSNAKANEIVKTMVVCKELVN